MSKYLFTTIYASFQKVTDDRRVYFLQSIVFRISHAIQPVLWENYAFLALSSLWVCL